jgi:Fe-S cluster assembly protein SufD
MSEALLLDRFAGGKAPPAALARLAGLALPTRREEAWKYTDLKALAGRTWTPAPANAGPLPQALAASLAALPEGPRLVFVDGRLRADLSRLAGLPRGLRLEAGAAAGASAVGRPFALLAEALAADGAAVDIAPGCVIEAPIVLAFLGDHPGAAAENAGFAAHVSNLINAGPGSSAAVIEIHRGEGRPYLANAATRIAVGEGARLTHIRIQAEGEAAAHVATTDVAVARDGLYDAFALATGARVARHEIAVRLEAPGAECRLDGAYLGRGRQVLETVTAIEHAAPDGRSREVYKGVLDDGARGVFQGRIVVARDAQRTDGHQLSRALLLSRGAEADAKPELEIWADDVKCSHGATVGEIDHDALFYLRARGIAEEAARAMLVEAFLAEALDEVGHGAGRALLAAEVAGWLGRKEAR